METSSTLWRRRVILMVVIGLVIAIPVTLLIRGSGDDGTAESAKPDVSDELPLNPPVNDKALEASYRVPEKWKADHKGDDLTLSSPDDSVQVGVSAPGPADQVDAIHHDALATLRASYESVDVEPGYNKEVGGLKAKGAVVAAQQDNVQLGILVSVAQGEDKTYVVEVFTDANAPERSVAEAQRFLESLELKG